MPDYRGISISLQSQYDCRRIPEYPPPSFTSVKASAATHEPDCTVNALELAQSPATTTPNIAEIYVPIYPASQFWIEYTTLDSTPMSQEMKYLYFKLYIHGSCVLSWGVGQKDDWTGKVMFGIYNGEMYFDRRKVLEKRAFFFPQVDENDGEYDGGFEIRVFRSKGRKREAFKHEELYQFRSEHDPISFIPAGRMTRSDPKRWYSYALLDPVDAPYAIFRYWCRTQSMLDAVRVCGEMGLTDSVEQLNQRSSATTISRAIVNEQEHIESGLDVEMSARSNTEPALPTTKHIVEQVKVSRRRSASPRVRPSSDAASGTVNASPDQLCGSNEVSDDPTATLQQTPNDNYRAGKHKLVSRMPPPPIHVPHSRLQRAVTPPSSMRRTSSLGLLNKVVTDAMKRKGEIREEEKQN